jgi:hypothetical protein
VWLSYARAVLQRVRTFDVERIDDVMVDELKVRVSEPVLDVAFASGKVIIERDYFVTLLQRHFSTPHITVPTLTCMR